MSVLGFVFTSLPHASAKGREGLDALLATSAYSEDIKVFFIADGVNQLRINQDPKQVLSRDYISAYKLLDLYDIDQVYVCKQSMDRYGMTVDSLAIECDIVTSSIISHELASCNKILTY
ncbi:sulfurtransferase TusC [Vibrio sp. 10N.286.49.C2]|uniref:sulfurtransferase complex subunit TusC n=1 Tax=unclassified Vibrio TaxID=2614977 RepID=UPI000C865DA7|nr:MULTISPECIES: sulfurtransferase complex subunit TusC [unclassified Vibrio]PMH41842.1 sulfurtransferase TusC [Vibrio sp. 10N.286.49.C2]PMH48155.1 sulfurtransferase TusC [Vibrio sp. 10N.286.49.B1]